MTRSKRRFTKWLVGGNVLLAWCAIFLSIIYAQAGVVAASAFGLILTLAGGYMGIGHMDLRQHLSNDNPPGDHQ
ncbi:hypothetical protein QD357_01965 [Rhizobium sp. BR 317]|uniref:hypothetical protein n=1 Tax=Rhizobium sp. BR 317 TaxID=3040015 RepID=UPI0039BF96B2